MKTRIPFLLFCVLLSLSFVSVKGQILNPEYDSVLAKALGGNDVPTIEEAEELIQTDPTVKSNIFDADLFELYGSAALPEYLKSHKKIEKFINP